LYFLIRCKLMPHQRNRLRLSVFVRATLLRLPQSWTMLYHSSVRELVARIFALALLCTAQS
jgi:hypothetical protein